MSAPGLCAVQYRGVIFHSKRFFRGQWISLNFWPRESEEEEASAQRWRWSESAYLLFMISTPELSEPQDGCSESCPHWWPTSVAGSTSDSWGSLHVCQGCIYPKYWIFCLVFLSYHLILARWLDRYFVRPEGRPLRLVGPVIPQVALVSGRAVDTSSTWKVRNLQLGRVKRKTAGKNSYRILDRSSLSSWENLENKHEQI